MHAWFPGVDDALHREQRAMVANMSVRELVYLMDRLRRSNITQLLHNRSWWLDPGGEPYPADSVLDHCYPLMDVIDFFHQYYIPAIILVGLVGNLLSCVVFLRTHLRMRSSSYYLAALAAADFGFLASLLVVWLNSNGDVDLFNRWGWCQALVYTSSVCSFLSVWLIVAFTVERFIAVQYPLRRPTMCTVARAKAIVAALAAVALLSHTYSFATAGLVRQQATWGGGDGGGEYVCEMLAEYHETMRVINVVDTTATLIVPFVLIVVMNTMITRNLLRFGRRFKGQPPAAGERSDIKMDTLPSSSSNNNNDNSNQNSGGLRRHQSNQSFHSSKSNSSKPPGRPTAQAQPLQHPDHTTTPSRCLHIRSSTSNLVSTKTQQSITKMLLLISTVFILLNLPSYVIRLYVFLFFSLWRQDTPPSLWCMQQFFMLLYYTNFSINFLLYSMCGITFRRCLLQLIRKYIKSLSRYRCGLERFS